MLIVILLKIKLLVTNPLTFKTITNANYTVKRAQSLFAE